MTGDQRTEGGAILRSGLDAVKAQAREQGKENAFAAVFSRKDGIDLGYARLDPSGKWELDARLKAKFEAGRLRDVRVDVGMIW